MYGYPYDPYHHPWFGHHGFVGAELPAPPLPPPPLDPSYDINPPPGVPFRRPPSKPGRWVMPQKEHFFNLPTRAEQDAVSNANRTIHTAVDQLLAAGLAPRWILEMVNRFIFSNQVLGTYEPTTADPNMPVPVEPLIYTVWDDAPSTMSPEDIERALDYWGR
jgi:hypothetical protein